MMNMNRKFFLTPKPFIIWHTRCPAACRGNNEMGLRRHMEKGVTLLDKNSAKAPGVSWTITAPWGGSAWCEW